MSSIPNSASQADPEPLLSRLKGVRPRKGGTAWSACCPAHNDDHPSLDIDHGSDGRLLLICRSRGCTVEGICQAIGLDLYALFPPQPGAGHKRQGPTAEYVYRDATGKPAYRVLRYPPRDGKKVFAQERASAGSWVGGRGAMDGVTRLLYRLPELLAADANQPVYIVEGEKDVDALTRLGVVATCNSGGAGKWQIDPAPLAGRDLVILPDNDMPGEAHTHDVLRKVYAVARSVRILKLPDLPHKGDVSDWLAMGHTAAELHELAANTPDEPQPAPWTETTTGTSADPPPSETPTEKPASRFKFLDAKEFFGADYRPEWLIPGIMVKGQPGAVGGPQKALKTSLMLDRGISLASGRPFLGRFEIPKRRRVAIASGESGAHTIQETARRVCKARDVDPMELSGWWSPCFDLPLLSDVNDVGQFEDALESIDAEVVDIDPFYLCLGDVDEKSLFQVGNVLRAVSNVVQRTGRTISIAHHTNGRLTTGEVPGLQHLAYSGFAQFARQWMLINRRSTYVGDGSHNLWMVIGGSVGHGGLWDVQIEEGVTGMDFGGRRWDVTVTDASEARSTEAAEKEAKKEEANRAKLAKEECKVLDAIDKEVAKGQPAATVSSLATAIAKDHRKVKEVIARLLESNRVEPHEFTKMTGRNTPQICGGYRRPQPPEDRTETPDSAGDEVTHVAPVTDPERTPKGKRRTRKKAAKK